MLKPPTGEPYAGEPHVRFGGRGGGYPFPTPIPAVGDSFLRPLHGLDARFDCLRFQCHRRVRLPRRRCAGLDLAGDRIGALFDLRDLIMQLPQLPVIQGIQRQQTKGKDCTAERHLAGWQSNAGRTEGSLVKVDLFHVALLASPA